MKEIDTPGYASALGWTPDGRALTFTLEGSGARNLHMQPLRGGPPTQLTRFDSESIDVAAYAWSNDGKKIAITRSRHNDSDVVMFSGLWKGTTRTAMRLHSGVGSGSLAGVHPDSLVLLRSPYHAGCNETC